GGRNVPRFGNDDALRDDLALRQRQRAKRGGMHGDHQCQAARADPPGFEKSSLDHGTSPSWMLLTVIIHHIVKLFYACPGEPWPGWSQAATVGSGARGRPQSSYALLLADQRQQGVHLRPAVAAGERLAQRQEQPLAAAAGPFLQRRRQRCPGIAAPV